MAWTAKQIADLNNSMVAAQQVSLGTVLGALVGTSSIVSGSIVPTASPMVINTGLTDVNIATVSLSGSPTLDHAWSTVTAGSAGWIQIYSYKPTGSTTVTPVAATTNFVAVSWIAVGEK